MKKGSSEKTSGAEPDDEQSGDAREGASEGEIKIPREFRRVGPQKRTKTLTVAGVFALFLIVAYALVPPLPLVWQLLAALLDSVLAGLIVFFAFAEFGRKVKRIKLPRIAGKKIPPQKPGTLGGWAMGAVVFVWWMTPWAPIRVDFITATELLQEFTDEVTQATAILPHEHLVVLQRPIPPQSAKEAAAEIPADADAFRLALRAMAMGDFGGAREKLKMATPHGEVTAAMILRVWPLIDLYDGQYAAAAKGFEEALAADKDDFDLACQTAVALGHAGLLKRAEELAESLLADAAEGSQRTTALNLLSTIYICQGKFQDARGVWVDDGDAATQMAGALNSQGVLNAALAKYDDAQLKYESAITAWRNRWDETRWKNVDVEIHVAPGVLNRGVGHYSVGNFAEAEIQLEDALKKYGALSAEHSAKGVASAALALLYFAQGRLEEAESLNDDAGRRFNKDTETHTLATRFLAARLDAMRGHYTRAFDVYSSLRSEIADPMRFAPNHPFTADVLHEMAIVRLLQAEGDPIGGAARLDEAARRCKSAIKVIEKYSRSESLTQGHWVAERVRTTLGRVLVAQGKSAAALAELKQAERQFGKALDQKDRKYVFVADNLAAQAETKTGAQAKIAGRSLYNDAVNIYIEALGAHGEAHPKVARWRYQLAKIELANNQPARAKANLEDAMRVQGDKQPRHPHFADTLRLYAEVLRTIDPDDSAAADAEKRAGEVTASHLQDEAAQDN